MLPVIDGTLHTMVDDAADIDEYPQTYEIQKRCVNMLSRLWHAPLEPEEGKEGGQGRETRGERHKERGVEGQEKCQILLES